MGREFEVICMACQNRFRISVGGGFKFELLHCTDCGKSKCVRLTGINRHIEPFDPDCSCGGEFSLDGKQRCTKCGSPDLLELFWSRERMYD